VPGLQIGNHDPAQGGRGTFADFKRDLSFDDIGFLRQASGLPVVVKGIVHPEDIRQSLAHVDRLEYFALVPRRSPNVPHKFAQLRSTGVTLLVGTDSGVPLTFHSDSTWREIDAWTRTIGVPAMEAIRAATYWPAKMMKVDKDVGTVSEGKYADVIAVRGDVLLRPDLLSDVALVIKHGVRYK